MLHNQLRPFHYVTELLAPAIPIQRLPAREAKAKGQASDRRGLSVSSAPSEVGVGELLEFGGILDDAGPANHLMSPFCPQNRLCSLEGERRKSLRRAGDSTQSAESAPAGRRQTMRARTPPDAKARGRHASAPGRSGGRGTRTPKGLRPAVFKTAALPIRSSPPKAPKTNGPRRPRLSASHSFFTIAVPMTGTFVQSLGIGALATLATGRDFEHAPQL